VRGTVLGKFAADRAWQPVQGYPRRGRPGTGPAPGQRRQNSSDVSAAMAVSIFRSLPFALRKSP
ncbi:MAG: hypothetical protein WBF88_09005, partial [Pusillimonas sp.]